MSQTGSDLETRRETPAGDNRDGRDQQDSGEGIGQQRPREQSAGRTRAEWVTFAISSILVLALFVLLIVQALFTGREPASISVHFEPAEARQEPSGYYLPLRIANSGDEAAEEVWVRIALEPKQGPTEVAVVALTFLTGHGDEEAGVVFQSDPAEGTLRVAGIGYLRP